MARLEDFDELGRDYFLSMPMPEFDGTPWIEPPPVTAGRIALISTAGLQRRGDRPFSVDSADFRLIPGDTPASQLQLNCRRPVPLHGRFQLNGVIGMTLMYHALQTM